MRKGMIGALSLMAGIVGGMVGTKEIEKPKLNKAKQQSDKHLALYLMMNQWVKVKQENKSIAEYLEKQGYKEIAIYGMNYVGETLLNELAGSGIHVKYGIDKKADGIYSNVEVISPEDVLEEVDVVVVTAITFFDEIEELLSEKLECPIISLEDILYEV